MDKDDTNFNQQIRIASAMAEVLNQYNIRYWLGGGIACEIHRGNIEQPKHDHGDIDFHVYYKDLENIVHLADELNRLGFAMLQPEYYINSEYHKIPLTCTDHNSLKYQVEIPLILNDSAGLYFVSWNKNSQTQRYYCDEDWFGSDSIELNGVKVSIVSKGYCETLYNSDLYRI